MFARKDTCDGKYWVKGTNEDIGDIMLCAGANVCLLKTFSQADMEEKTLVRGTVEDHLFSWFSFKVV